MKGAELQAKRSQKFGKNTHEHSDKMNKLTCFGCGDKFPKSEIKAEGYNYYCSECYEEVEDQ